MNKSNASGIKGLLHLVVAAVALGSICMPAGVQAGQQTFPASGTFTPGTGVTSVTVQAWGGGGAGAGDSTNNTIGACGGGGGAYAKKNSVAVTPGVGQTVVVGTGGTGGTGAGPAGTDSYFINNTTVLAKGGNGGAIEGGGGGAGGAAGACVGDTVYSGGAGSVNPSATASAGGGGGSSAGTAAVGVSAVNTRTGATAPSGGGNGGSGALAGSNGTAGSAPGGGGGGAGNRTGGGRTGGSGAAGQVIVGWGATCTINQAAGQADPTNANPVSFTVVFSEAVSGFTTADITLGGTATGKVVSGVSGSGTTYTVTVTATGSGTITASVPLNAANETFGYGNFASTSTDNQVTYTTASNPTVTINQAGGQVDPTNGLITYTVVFSEVMKAGEFVAGDVTLTGTAPASVTNVTTSDNKTYTVTVTATDSGTVIADIGAGVATSNASGLANVASTSTDKTVTFDNLKPSVTIEQGAAQADPTSTSPITFDVVFSEPVTGFATTDVTLSGTATGKSVTGVVPATGPAANYTVTVAVTGSGSVLATIPAGAASDAAGNTSNVSTSTDNSVDFAGGCVDATPSTITIPGSQTVSGLGVDLTALYSKTGNVGSITYTINAVSVDSPWDSSAFGVSGPQAVTFAVSGIDPDCGGTVVSQSNTITVDNSTLNFLMHNSKVTGSTKWPIAQSGDSVNGWGIANAQYGAFTCGTCHARTTTNIKRIKTTLTAPNSPTDTLPIGAGTVQLLSAADGSSQYGNDLGGHATSNRICEACHSKNKFHNYNTANNTGGLTHANQSDCMSCHPHKQGFKSPGCNSCHGNPPTSSANMVFTPASTGALADPVTAPGAHAKHVMTKAMKCETCHKGNTMPTASMTIQMGFEANATNVPGFNGTVTGGTLQAPQDAMLINTYTFVSSDGSTTVNKVANDNLNCTVYCHGNWVGNAGTTNSPSWVGTNQAPCGACHSTSVTAPPQTGSHNVHVLNTGNVKLTCNKCHPTYSDTAHLDGNVAWQLATADARIGASATYTAFGKAAAASGTTGNKAPSGTYGTCSIYCHGTNTPTWGGPNINCDGCHSASSTLEGSHAKHYGIATAATGNTTTNNSTTTAYVFQCGTCHNAASTAHAGGPVSGVQSAQVSLSGGGTYTAGGSAAAGSPDGVFNYTAGTCGFNACHNNGKATPGAPNVVATWTGTLPVNCTGCHNNNAASGSPMNSNGHPSHVSAAAVMSIKPCQMCHDGTVDANDQAISDKTFHVNGTRDIRILGTWDSDATPNNNWNGTQCTNVYCHSNGQATPTYQPIAWTTNIGCTGCHGGPGITTTLTASHLAHIGTDPSDTNKQFAYTCDDCHVMTASNNNAISAGGLTYHINKTRDVSVAVANGGTGTIVGGDYGEDIVTPRPDSCGTTKCHGESSPSWTAGTTNGNCSTCHGMSDPAKTGRDTNGDTSDTDLQVGAHAAHLNSSNNYSADVTCDQCHNTTVTSMASQLTYVNKVNAAGHFDSQLPAETSWGAIAGADSAVPNYDSVTGVCTNYCHGATLANAVDPMPNWNQSGYLTGTLSATGDCNRCHGAPPLITGHTGSETLADCGTCHTETMNLGVATFKDVTKHVDGTLQVYATCTTCHGSLPPSTGSHPKHGVHLVQDIGMSAGNPNGVLADWNGTNYPMCDVCHDMSVQSNHLDPTSNILGAAAPANVWFLNGTPPSYDSGTQTCSNVACHLKPTPDWAP
jgi:predicted CxxxxCH...CXXCH cytochrome family protein